jgi:hypothetical protein
MESQGRKSISRYKDIAPVTMRMKMGRERVQADMWNII